MFHLVLHFTRNVMKVNLNVVNLCDNKEIDLDHKHVRKCFGKTSVSEMSEASLFLFCLISKLSSTEFKVIGHWVE